MRSMPARLAPALAVLALTFVLDPARAPAEEAPKLKLLVITGSHQHEWEETTKVMKEFLEKTGRFKVDVTVDPPKDLDPSNLEKYDVLLLHYRESAKKPGRWPAEAEKALVDAVRGGKGLVVLHYASSAFDVEKVNWPEYEKLIGGGWRRSKGFGSHAAMYQFRVDVKDPAHPITRGFPPSFIHAKDELYHKLMQLEGNHVLAEALDEAPDGKGTGKKEPMAWVLTYGKGRVFHDALGHTAQQFRAPGFQALLARGAEWAATGKVTVPVPSKLDSPPESPRAKYLGEAAREPAPAAAGK